MRDETEEVGPVEEPCEVCGICPDEELIPGTYEVIWDCFPHLRAGQDAGEEVYCEECGRQLAGPNLVSDDPLNWPI